MKWGGAVAVILLVGVWVASWWWWIQLTPSGATQITIARGRLFVEGRTASWPNRWQVDFIADVDYPPVEFSWVFYAVTDPQNTNRYVPLWLPTLLIFIPSACAWWLDLRAMRRARIGLCRACGYDRRGLAAGSVCPECGAGAKAGVAS